MLQDDGKVITRALTCYDEDLFNSMLDCVPKESREAVIKQLLHTIPQTMEEIYLDPSQKHCLYWMNIVQFIVDHANRDQLQNVVNTISTMHDTGDYKCSIWSNFLCDAEHYTNFNEKIDTFLRFVTVTLGENSVKELLLHDGGKATTCASLRYDENIVNTMMANLSYQYRREVGKAVIDNVPRIIDTQIFETLPHWMNILQLLVDYADNDQLSKLVDAILKINVPRRNNEYARSIWGLYLDNYNSCTTPTPVRNALEKIDTFLKLVWEKLGESRVEDLVLHDDGQGIVIRSAARKNHNDLVDTMLTNLNDKVRAEIHRGNLLLFPSCVYYQ